MQETSEHEMGAMTIRHFCHWAGIGRTMAYKEIGCGRLKTVKVGRRRLVKWSDAQLWLNSLQVDQ
jgi:hypothetical protein